MKRYDDNEPSRIAKSIREGHKTMITEKTLCECCQLPVCECFGVSDIKTKIKNCPSCQKTMSLLDGDYECNVCANKRSNGDIPVFWTKATVRNWRKNEYLPTSINGKQDFINFERGTVLDCYQPDKLDSEEYNLIVKLPKTSLTVLMRSIDFDFQEVK